MSIAALPASPKFNECRFLCRGNTGELTSPLTRSVQVLDFTGARWAASFGLPPMKRETAQAWNVWLVSLRGRRGRFYAGPPDAVAPQGIGTGVPLVKGAGQTGTTLLTDGWTSGVTGILKAGDYVAFATPTSWRELHIVCVDATSDGSGNASLMIAPPLRETPADNAPLIISNPTCVMRLATDDEARWAVEPGMIYGIRFNAEEAFQETY